MKVKYYVNQNILLEHLCLVPRCWSSANRLRILDFKYLRGKNIIFATMRTWATLTSKYLYFTFQYHLLYPAQLDLKYSLFRLSQLSTASKKLWREMWQPVWQVKCLWAGDLENNRTCCSPNVCLIESSRVTNRQVDLLAESSLQASTMRGCLFLLPSHLLRLVTSCGPFPP